MISPIKIADKIEDFAVEISIADIALLTKGLIQLQHARYPHLVPMYRTVHRTKPRKLVLRAIRWVNPKRMFPGAGLTRAEMEDMSSQELSDLIVKLNDYRGEAHVIHNRYNQMIDLINMGELPYFIPYAWFKQDKWSMLQEYMDRAERIKDGTQERENELDRQANEIRMKVADVVLQLLRGVPFRIHGDEHHLHLRGFVLIKFPDRLLNPHHRGGADVRTRNVAEKQYRSLR